jgi:peptidyl-prolyl cis-trans isomerase C
MPTATARHILVDTEAECRAVLARLEEGADFAELAKKHSKCPSGRRGGDLGSFGRGDMVPEFDEAVFAAKVGDVLGPVETPFGFHVVQVTSREG